MVIKAKTINEKKKIAVEKIIKLANSYPIIGIVNIQNLPASELQVIRENLRENVVLFITKKRLMRIAFEKLKDKLKGIDGLEKYMKGMPALIFTKDNPFKLFKRLEKGKSPSFIKAGQIAPKDIIVKAGPTSFSPGPIIGELGSIGLKTMIDKGKITIKEDKVVVKEGETVSDKVASILSRLGIKPIESGLDLIAAYEDGSILLKEILEVDEQVYITNIMTAVKQSINLSVETGYLTKDTAEIVIIKAYKDALMLSIEQSIINKDNLDRIINKAMNIARIIKTNFNL